MFTEKQIDTWSGPGFFIFFQKILNHILMCLKCFLKVCAQKNEGFLVFFFGTCMTFLLQFRDMLLGSFDKHFKKWKPCACLEPGLTVGAYETTPLTRHKTKLQCSLFWHEFENKFTCSGLIPSIQTTLIAQTGWVRRSSVLLKSVATNCASCQLLFWRLVFLG